MEEHTTMISHLGQPQMIESIPTKVVEKMIKSLEMPTYDEAFDIIVV